VLVDSHPAGGFLELSFGDEYIVLNCHWPFDLEEDDWIDIQNTYYLSSYLHAVSNAMTNGNGQTHGIRGGSLHITNLDDGFAIEVSRPASGWPASSLELRVRRPIEGLLP
jgi:hypothetical protein